jgi:hypothetical protein
MQPTTRQTCYFHSTGFKPLFNPFVLLLKRTKGTSLGQHDEFSAPLVVFEAACGDMQHKIPLDARRRIAIARLLSHGRTPIVRFRSGIRARGRSGRYDRWDGRARRLSATDGQGDRSQRGHGRCERQANEEYANTTSKMVG